ncbi:MAG: RNase adapter RapZ [Oscillibacter sp.]
MERLKQGGDICRLLFVTADLETIIKRYKETRRRHPLMSDGMTIEQAMHREQVAAAPAARARRLCHRHDAHARSQAQK